MNEAELLELRQLLKEAYENNDWTSIQESIEWINEYIEIDDESEYL